MSISEMSSLFCNIYSYIFNIQVSCLYTVLITEPARHFNSFLNRSIFLRLLISSLRIYWERKSAKHIAGLLSKAVLGSLMTGFYTTKTGFVWAQINTTCFRSFYTGCSETNLRGMKSSTRKVYQTLRLVFWNFILNCISLAENTISVPFK